MTRFASYAAAACILIATVGGLSWYLPRMMRVQDSFQEPAIAANVETVERELGRMRALEQANTRYGLRFVAFRAKDGASDIRAQAVWDELSRQWHFFGFEIPSLMAKDEYVLWLVPIDHKPVAARAFRPPNGNDQAVSFVFSSPLDPGMIARMVISAESKRDPLPSSPSHRIVLTADFAAPQINSDDGP